MVKQQNQLPQLPFQDKLVKIVNELQNQPLETEKQTNPWAENAVYIPIETIEAKLDLYFPLSWQTSNFNWQVIANEIVGSLDLTIYNPVLGAWITRTGAGAAQIQQVSKKKGGSGDPTAINEKLQSTLTKDFPHLKAECLKNAAKSLGQTFGRDLNRSSASEPVQEQDINQALEGVNNCTTKKELLDYVKSLPRLVQQSKELQSRVKAKKLEFEYNQNL